MGIQEKPTFLQGEKELFFKNLHGDARIEFKCILKNGYNLHSIERGLAFSLAMWE